MIEKLSGADISCPFIPDAMLLPFLILISSVILAFAVSYYLKKYIGTRIQASQDATLLFFFQTIKGLPRVWIFGIGVYLTIHTLNLPEPVQQGLSALLFTIIVFSVTRVIARVLEHGVMQHTAGITSTNNSTSTLLSTLVELIVYSFGAVIILGYLGISIAPILTALGVGGMAVALGLQDSLANFFAGLHLIMSKQVRIGDHISLASGDTGEVVDITWRYTTLRTSANNTVIVPNKNISTTTLTNYDNPAPRLSLVVPVGVSYDSDLESVETITLEVARDVMQGLEGYQEGELDPPKLFFHTFGESSIDFNVVLHARSLADQHLLKHRFIKELTKRYRDEGISIPFPVRTIMQGTESLPKNELS